MLLPVVLSAVKCIPHLSDFEKRETIYAEVIAIINIITKIVKISQEKTSAVKT